MPSKQVVSVRGANGLNLYVTATEPSAVEDLYTCQNVDLGVRRAVLPRLGLGRPSGWVGLINTDTGKIYANEFGAGVGGAIISMCAAPGMFVDPPSVAV